jgi:capsular polysaccharide biosynthesis protein
MYTLNANSGLRKEESIGNGRLFGFHGIGNEGRKDVNQEINRRSMASVFNFKSIFEVAKNRLNDEAWYKHFSTVVASEERQQKIHKFNNRIEYRHEHKYDAKNIVGKIAEQIAEEISKNIKDNTIKYIGLKESRKKGKIEPAVRIILSNPTKK